MNENQQFDFLDINPLRKVKSSPYIIYREVNYGFRYVTVKTIKIYEDGKREITKVEKY